MSEYETKLRRVEDDLRSLQARLDEPGSERYREYLMKAIDALKDLRDQYSMMVMLERQ